MADLLQLLQPSAVIETGTYGEYPQNGSRAIIVDGYTRWRRSGFTTFRPKPNSEVFLTFRMNLEITSEGLRHALSILRPDETVLIYLDARWEKDLPLREELAVFFNRRATGTRCHRQFRVPDDSGYHWDDYGPGKVFDIGLLAEELPPKTVVTSHPWQPRRKLVPVGGCCVIATKLANRGSEIARCCGAPRYQTGCGVQVE